MSKFEVGDIVQLHLNGQTAIGIIAESSTTWGEEYPKVNYLIGDYSEVGKGWSTPKEIFLTKLGSMDNE